MQEEDKLRRQPSPVQLDRLISLCLFCSYSTVTTNSFLFCSTTYDECTAHVQKYGKTLSGQLSFPLFIIVEHAIL